MAGSFDDLLPDDLLGDELLGDPSDEPRPPSAILVTNALPDLRGDVIRDAMNRLAHLGGPVHVRAEEGQEGGDRGTLAGVVRWGELTIRLTGFEGPVPDQVLDTTVEVTDLPEEAKRQARDHAAHVIVSCSGELADPADGWLAIYRFAIALGDDLLAVLDEHAARFQTREEILELREPDAVARWRAQADLPAPARRAGVAADDASDQTPESEPEPEPEPDDLEELVAFATATARAAGALLLERFRPTGGPRQVEKKGVRELVTSADRASEELIVARIRERYPDHAIFAEEGTARDEDDANGLWVIDPLDGTTNWAHGFPLWAVSIAFRRRGRTDVGVVCAPYPGETFVAGRGLGAWLLDHPRSGLGDGDDLRGGTRLQVTGTDTLIEAVLATGFAYDLNETENHNIDSWGRLVRITRALRRPGAASYDLACLAAGRFDGFWELFLQPYDVAAGALLIEEAGGRVTDRAGGDDWLFGRTIVASNGALHDALRSALAPPVDDGTLPRSAFGPADDA